MSPQRVHVISTGGTISMLPSQSGLVPSLSAHDLVPASASLDAELTTESLEPLPGASLTSESINTVVERARAAIREGASGVVVTQGTDTIEETSFLAELLWGETRPLVFTGAMRSADAPGSDGMGNLAASIRVAAHSHSADRGVLVVFGDEVFAASDVAKIHSSKPAAFSAPGKGPLATISEHSVSWNSVQSGSRQALFDRAHSAKTVITIVAQLEQSSDILTWARTSDSVSGVVIAAMGVGHVPSWWVDELSALAAEKPTVFSTRTGSGSVFLNTYGFSGSERDLVAADIRPAGFLSAHKARLLLAQCIGVSKNASEAKKRFSEIVSEFGVDA